jgi:Holliday junction resolvasome RuvABC DNA-binding subunit
LEGISCMNPPDWLESASDMLIALGYSRKEVSTGVQDYLAQFPDSDDSEEAIRHVLQYR